MFSPRNDSCRPEPMVHKRCRSCRRLAKGALPRTTSYSQRDNLGRRRRHCHFHRQRLMRPSIPPICRFHRRRSRRRPPPIHGPASTLGLALVLLGNEPLVWDRAPGFGPANLRGAERYLIASAMCFCWGAGQLEVAGRGRPISGNGAAPPSKRKIEPKA